MERYTHCQADYGERHESAPVHFPRQGVQCSSCILLERLLTTSFTTVGQSSQSAQYKGWAISKSAGQDHQPM